MSDYVVVFEVAGSNCSAHVPDLPSCVSTGATPEDAESGIREAIALYLETLADDGCPAPPARTRAHVVSVAA